MWITGFSVSATRQAPQGWGSKSFSFTFAYLLFVDSPSVWLFEKTPFSFTSLLRMTRTCAVGIHLDRIKTEREKVYKTFFYTLCVYISAYPRRLMEYFTWPAQCFSRPSWKQPADDIWNEEVFSNKRGWLDRWSISQSQNRPVRFLQYQRSQF